MWSTRLRETARKCNDLCLVRSGRMHREGIVAGREVRLQSRLIGHEPAEDPSFRCRDILDQVRNATARESHSDAGRRAIRGKTGCSQVYVRFDGVGGRLAVTALAV